MLTFSLQCFGLKCIFWKTFLRTKEMLYLTRYLSKDMSQKKRTVAIVINMI